ncbi:hypothetical protein ABL78_5270 [Leptomonas seymouri]|uniref:Phytoene synthase n=1 Tax=Leptomonas seymouri TaxID=5684 RepID=A0A0N1HX38_LEPSE|nr:hypothetical protein ABL78_5270 [Leptomonas seymouri]|eukprot:KPI85690.1 hypothetical protein ABL78_5270 [Leptomonas seymouri]
MLAVRGLCRARTARVVKVAHQPALVMVQRFQSNSSTTTTSPPLSSNTAPDSANNAATASKVKAAATKPRGIWFDREEGISKDLKGIGVYAGSISAFMKSPEEKKAAPSFKSSGDGGRLPCEDPGTSAALQAAQAGYMASVAKTGKLPSPRRGLDAKFATASISHGSNSAATASCAGHSQGHGESHTHGAASAVAARGPSSLPRRAPPTALNTTPRKPPAALSVGGDKKSSLPPRATAAASASTADEGSSKASGIFSDGSQLLLNKEASDYYKSLPQNELTKEEMWSRINAAHADKAEAGATAIGSLEVDYVKMEEEMREFDLFHYRVGEMAYPDAARRRNYYAMWNLAMSLNKARWTMLEVHSQRGMKTTGAGMKLIFWKESIGAIMEKRRMNAGQFTDSHPVLRPFAAAVEQNPHMTKAFVRGFTDARLKVIQQPGNVQQLFDHFDKFYGYFFNSLLEVTNVKDEAAEHLMTHIGRATGLTNHCVMFWKKYARLGFTMLPSDICADNHVNLALLKNIPLASQDRAVRKVLFDVMCIVKDEMMHAQKIAKDVPPKAWPLVMECLYANYYLGFLQRREFNVSAMFADHNIENAGFAWYRLKKRWEWEKYQSIERLLEESAPIPFIGTSFAHRGSQYKQASGLGRDPARL